MTYPFRIVGGLVLALALMGTTGCAATRSLSPREASQVLSRQQSAVAFGYGGYELWLSAEAYFENLSTGERYRLAMDSHRPGIVMLPPGRYRLKGAELTDVRGSAASLPLLSYWFDDFDVGSGEVVDLGVLGLHGIEVRASANLEQHILSLFDDNRLAGRDTLMAYTIDQSNERWVLEMLAASNPSLTGALVRHPLRPLLEPADFEQAIAEAYSPNADGTPPSTETAEAKFAAKLDVILRQRRARPPAP